METQAVILDTAPQAATPPLSSPSGEQGRVCALWRYPVKSMMGEELNAAFVTPSGVLGDRAFALRDDEGKLVTAKNPRKWPEMFAHRAAFVEPLPLSADAEMPPVRMTLPNGDSVLSSDPNASQMLSESLGRAVTWETVAPQEPVIEEFWPADVEGLPYADAVTDENTLSGTFFDLSTMHVLTTSTLDAMKAIYPPGRFEARRFRPNIIVETSGEGFVENAWIGHTIKLGEVEMEITGPCPRCVMTTVAQYDLPKDSGILRTAVQHNEGGVGVYAKITKPGVVRRNDVVEIKN